MNIEFISYNIVSHTVFSKVLKNLYEEEIFKNNLKLIIYNSNSKEEYYKHLQTKVRFDYAVKRINSILNFTKLKRNYECHLLFYRYGEGIYINAYTNKRKVYNPLEVKELKIVYDEFSNEDKSKFEKAYSFEKTKLSSFKKVFNEVLDFISEDIFKSNNDFFLSRANFLLKEEYLKNFSIINPVELLAEEMNLDNKYKSG